MPEQVENAMVVNWWWDEIEYGVPARAECLEEVEDDE